MTDIVEIMPNLFLGTANATNGDVLTKFNINCVLNVASHRENFNTTRKLDDWLLLEVEDSWHASEKMSKVVIPQALTFIAKHLTNDKRILVRSFTFVHVHVFTFSRLSTD